MARRTFFSFHYQRDIWRANIIKNSWVTRSDREDAGFFDASVFEEAKKKGDENLKRFLHQGLDGSSVTCVLAGAETYLRRWVRYELIKSFIRGNGILCVSIHQLQDRNQRTDTAGENPLANLAFRVADDRIEFHEKLGEKWSQSNDLPSMSLSNLAYDLGDKKWHTFATLFQTYDWVNNDGYNNIADWIESAAKAANR